VGATSYFAKRPAPKTPRDLIEPAGTKSPRPSAYSSKRCDNEAECKTTVCRKTVWLGFGKYCSKAG
jgi:hypothetical protein